MALRPAPKRKAVDYEKLDELQKEIFGSTGDENGTQNLIEKSDESIVSTEAKTSREGRRGKSGAEKKNTANMILTAATDEEKNLVLSDNRSAIEKSESDVETVSDDNLRENLKDMETIAARIVSTKAGQGRNTTRPFSIPRTLIIDTTRLKAKFRTIDEQFTQNVIIDFLLREALSVATPENYRDLRTSAFDFVKRSEETTRRSLTVTEAVVYQMSELKAGINLETGRKYSNDEIFSTLLAVGVSWLYRNGVLN